MTDQKKRRGPKPEVFKVPLKFEDAVKAALATKAPKKEKGSPSAARQSGADDDS